MELIASSRLEVHDLSRMRAAKAGDISRLNMPFELGLDMGCRYWGGGRHEGKRQLILEAGRFEFHRAISDISNSDIKARGNEPRKLVKQIRNWLVENGLAKAPGGGLWIEYAEFLAYFQKITQSFDKEDLDEMPLKEYLDHIAAWLGEK